ncbi:MAG TPA: site-2 protease family protein [Candidatus Saccharimonadales bacterium]
MSVVLLILGILLFVGLVVFHEFGHFIAARRNGVEVEEFGIGFPPRAWARKTKKGFLFTLNWLPVGGFVRLKGEHDADTAKGSFGAASLGTKTKIMLAGVAMNLIAAFVLLMILAWAGMPQLVSNQFTVASDSKTTNAKILVGSIESGSPAAKANLQPHDQLIGAWSTYFAPACPPTSAHPTCGAIVTKRSFTTFTTTTSLTSYTKDHAGQSIELVIARSGKRITTSPITLLSTQAITAAQKAGQVKGYLGTAPASYALTRSTWSAPVVAAGLIKQFTVLTFEGLGHAVKGLGSAIAGTATSNKSARQNGQTEATSEVSGPVGIVVVLHDSSLLGYQFVLFIIAIISLTLAIMNVLPIPALDGGRLFMLIVARLLHKPLTEAVEEQIVGASFAVLMVLLVVITVVDVKRFF